MNKLKIFFVVWILLFSFAVKAQNNSDDVIKVETALVNIPVIVSDRNGRNISGLQTDNFTVFEDGKQQKIEYFASEETPINVAILLDTSLSTQDVLGKIKNAARGFIKQLQPNDQCLIMSFDNNIEILSEFTSDKKSLDRAIRNAEIGERVGTVLQDALFEAIDKKLSRVKGRKAVILLTDGKDAGSYVTKNELIYRLEESDTLVYSIFYETTNLPQLNNNRRGIFFPNGRMGGRRQQFPMPDDFPRPNQNPNRQNRQRRMNESAVDFLQKITDATAGRLYQKETEELEDTFRTIADELRKQYVIGYYPDNSQSEKTIHQVKVRVDKTDVVVRAKGSYRSK